MKFKSDIEVQAGLKDSSGSAGTSGKILSSTGTGVAWVDDNPGVSGSGTTNYLSKFTGTTTLGNSLLFDDGTYVGIGTTSPTYRLDVSTPNINTFRTKNTTAASGNTINIHNDSNLGLNTTVYGSAYSAGSWLSLGANGVALHSNSTANFGILTTTSTSLLFGTNNVERMRITSAGNVGIGTSSPAYKLQVAGGIYQNDTTFISYYDGAVRFGGLNSYSTIITNTGNVGIGTASPTNRLQVEDSVNSIVASFKGAGGSTYSTFNIMTLGANANGFWRASTIGGNIKMVSNQPAINANGFSASAIAFGSDTSQGRIGFFTTSSNTGDTVLTESMRIDTNGNVGIGTSSPTVKLHLLSSSENEVRVQESTNNAFISLYQQSTTSYLIAGRTGSTPTQDLSIYTGGGEKIRILANGNVGIGTSTPQRKLDVISGANNFVSVGISQMSVGQWAGIGFGYAEGSNNLYRKSAIVFERTDLTLNNAQGKVHILNGPQGNANSATLSDSKLTIAENGNVGIGTTSPSGKLHVVGTSPSVFVDTSNTFAVSIGAASATPNIVAIGTSGSGVPQIQGYTNGFGSTANLSLQPNGANVGIGTTSADSRLHISSTASNLLRMVRTGGTATNFGFELGSGAIGIYNYSTSTYGWYLGSTGNLGIGTTSPGAKLDVNGDALINQLTIGQGPVVGQGNTALGKGALGSMVGGKANIAVGSNANSDNDVTGLTVIGVDLNVNPAGSALTQDSLVIGQYNALNYSTQYPHIYAPDKVNCPNGNTTTDVIAVDYSIYTAIFMEYSIFNSAGDQFRAGTYTAAFKGTGTVIEDDNQTVVYSGTTLAATFTTSVTGNVVTIQLRNQDSDTYDIRVTARLLMR